MRILVSAFLLATAMTTACAAPTGDDASDTTSEAALSSPRLEKSHVAVELDQKNGDFGVPGQCAVEKATFRITYTNPTLPAGTKITLHAGESYSDQGWIGDGFGWGQWSRGTWGSVRDLPMNDAGGTFTVDTTASSYTKYPAGQYYIGMPDPVTFAPELSFVFRLELPDGTVLWDNRLRQDYWVSGNGPACPSGTTGGFIPRASWGPY